MKVIERCEFCEMSLAYEVDGQIVRFTAHDDSFCKEVMCNTIRMMRDAMKSNTETMAQHCIEFGRKIERWRDESREERERGRREGLIAATLRDADLVRDISKTGGEG